MDLHAGREIHVETLRHRCRHRVLILVRPHVDQLLVVAAGQHNRPERCDVADVESSGGFIVRHETFISERRKKQEVLMAGGPVMHCRPRTCLLTVDLGTDLDTLDVAIGQFVQASFYWFPQTHLICNHNIACV